MSFHYGLHYIPVRMDEPTTGSSFSYNDVRMYTTNNVI